MVKKIDRSKAGAVMMANRSIEAVIGEACLPVTFSETMHSTDFNIIPGLPDTCVLGMDFAEQCGIVLHLRDKQLWLAYEPIIKVAFRTADRDSFDTCKGITLLDESEKVKLDQFLSVVIPPPPDKSGKRIIECHLLRVTFSLK